MCANKWKPVAGLIFALVLCLGLAVPAHAHGARIEYTVDMVIEIVANYDSGEPMAGAQVCLYA